MNNKDGNGTQKESMKNESRGPAKRSPSAARSPSSRQNGFSVSTQKAPVAPNRSPTKEEQSGSGVTAASAPAQITADALASINYAAFSQGSLNPKQRRARMLKDFLASHSTGAQLIMEEWREEHEALWSKYLQASHTPQSREIQRLMTLTRQIEASCQQRLQHADAITRCALGGIEELVTRLTESGMAISAVTRVLSGEPDPILATGRNSNDSQEKQSQAMERGSPLAEVRGFDPSKPDLHPPAFRITEAEHDEVERLKSVFERAAASIMARTAHGSCAKSPHLSSPLRPPTVGHLSHQSVEVLPANDATTVTSGVQTEYTTEHAEVAASATSTAADEEQLRQVNELHRELNVVGDALVALVKRVEVQQRQYQAKIAAQRDALDAAATRTKLADDVLRGTVAQGEVEACSAVVEVQQLSLELRRRMEASETAMQFALDQLIKESAEVCVANDALHDYAALTLNRDNCLYAYMSRIERQVVEQASVLREAQDTVTRLWSRLHTSGQQLLQQQPSLAQSATDEIKEKMGTSFALPTVRRVSSISLPPLYQKLLRNSDRATLLNLAEQLSQHSTEVAEVIVRVLDEHQARNALHPMEAAAAREAHLRTVATQQLLEKLDSEGYLRSNTRQTTLPLSERITHLVAQYDAYIDFNEQHARALVRQADVERREQSPSQFAFFDTRTPTPGLKSGSGLIAQVATAGNKSFNACSIPKTYAGISPTTSASRNSRAVGGNASSTASQLPYMQLREGKPRNLQQQQRGFAVEATGSNSINFTSAASPGRIVNYLERSSAQELLPLPPRASVVGGNNNGGFNGGPAGAPSTSTIQRCRHTTIGATASTCKTNVLPPPPVPPRAGLISYVLSTYTAKAADGNGDGEAAGQKTLSAGWSMNHALPYRDGDRQFIERQREVFQQLD